MQLFLLVGHVMDIKHAKLQVIDGKELIYIYIYIYTTEKKYTNAAIFYI